MNRFLTNNIHSQHADTVAQGTNSKSFHIPCATEPQIVANRYPQSPMHMKTIFLLFAVLSCNSVQFSFRVDDIARIDLIKRDENGKVTIKHLPSGLIQDFMKELTKSESVGLTKFHSKYKINIVMNDSSITILKANKSIFSLDSLDVSYRFSSDVLSKYWNEQ